MLWTNIKKKYIWNICDNLTKSKLFTLYIIKTPNLKYNPIIQLQIHGTAQPCTKNKLTFNIQNQYSAQRADIIQNEYKLEICFQLYYVIKQNSEPSRNSTGHLVLIRYFHITLENFYALTLWSCRCVFIMIFV